MDIVLGRRPNKTVARPLETLSFRARLDLALSVERPNDTGALQLRRIPITVDDTPLRIEGRVGESLYRAARAAGAPSKAVETYIRAINTRIPVSSIGSDAQFDMVIAQRRAETGEVEMGELLYAGLQNGRRKAQLLKWNSDGRSEWFEASGVGERRGMMQMPVSGHMTSSFGMRFHPLLGYTRFHRGIDIGAAYGAPIVAAADGKVVFAGWHGGHGNFVSLQHGSGMGTGYGHMSRIAVRDGQRVSQGQVIGYVGSTGLSTGPHLHYEVYKNGQAIDPKGVSFITTAQLAGAELARFKASLARLLSVRAGVPAPMKPASVKTAALPMMPKG
jgi:murein DD-endopeptidase MepM/ murein hydrolase activator NlpD